MTNKETYKVRHGDETRFVSVVRTTNPRKERRELLAEVCGQYKNLRDLITDALESASPFEGEEWLVDAYEVIVDDREIRNFKKKENNRVSREARTTGLDESAFLDIMPKIAKIRVYGVKNSI